MESVQSLRQATAQLAAEIETKLADGTLKRIMGETDGYCNHTKFFPGAERGATTAAQPCEPAFVEALASDLFYWAYRTGHELSQIAELDRALTPGAIKVVDFLRHTIAQSRRLQRSPDLFPSSIIRDNFLSLVAKLSDQLATIGETVLKLRSQQNKPSKTKRRTDQNGNDEPINMVENVPAFSPDRPDGKHPWNNWLDNSARSVPGWVAIQQKIPRYGDRMNRRLALSYDAVERDFEKNELVDSKTRESSTEIPRPGDSFKHMSWSGFTTMPFYDLGFKAGTRKDCDGNGMVTLEHLSQALFLVENEPWDRATQHDYLETSNCPYFRFAVAYKP